jgi:hypothetical protein
VGKKQAFRERLLARDDANLAFRALVSEGVDPDVLQQSLFKASSVAEAVYVGGAPSTRTTWGLADKGQIGRLIKNLRGIADKVAAINSSKLGNPDSISYWERKREGPTALREAEILKVSIEALPHLLRVYAGLLAFQSVYGLKHRRTLLVAVAEYEESRLLSYVHRQTKRRHYAELATLLGASFELVARSFNRKVRTRAEKHYSEEALRDRQKRFRRHLCQQ